MRDLLEDYKNNFNTLKFYQKVITIAGLCYLIALLFIESKGVGDIDIYLKASRDLFSGKNIYNMLYHVSSYDSFHYYYDILFAIIISPLRVFNLYWASFIWLAINFILTFRIWKILVQHLHTDFFSNQKYWLFLTLAFVFVFSVWHKNIRYGQATILILYLCLEGIHQIQKNKWIIGCILISLGISIKILPIVLVPYLIYRRYYKESVAIVFSFALIAFVIPILFFGYDRVVSLLNERWLLLNPMNSEHILDVEERSFHSLTTFLAVLLHEGAGNHFSLELKRNIADVDISTLSIIINIVRAFFIILSLYFISSLPFKRSKTKIQSLYELSYILLIVPLIFPHQQHYAFFFAFPGSVYLMYFVLEYYFSEQSQVNNNRKILIVTILGFQFLLLNSHYLLGNFVNYYDHYKTLTYGILSLIPLLAFAKPDKISNPSTIKVRRR